MTQSGPRVSRFDGRAVVVTGAASGIGRCIALRLAGEGAAVLAADINAQALDETVQMAGGRRIFAHEVDITDVTQISSMVDRCLRDLGALDGLVNCAGVVQTKPMLELSPREWDSVLDVNLRGTFFCLQAAGAQMSRARGGSIINVSSVAGRSGRPYSAHYAASKMAIISITRSAALALAPGVRVNTICPGIVDTPMWEQIDLQRSRLFGVKPGDSFKAAADAVPLKRAATPDEIASVAAFLMSDEASYVTGQAINVDGGLEMD